MLRDITTTATASDWIIMNLGAVRRQRKSFKLQTENSYKQKTAVGHDSLPVLHEISSSTTTRIVNAIQNALLVLSTGVCSIIQLKKRFLNLADLE